MKRILPFFKNQLGEISLLLFFLVITTNILTKKKTLIDADGRGYYEFLPATFIYNDLQLNYLDTLKSDFYDNEFIKNQFYPRLENGIRYDKYFIGTAILQAPFFGVSHAFALSSSTYKADGFSQPYQTGIFCAALFYLFGGLIFIRLLLKTFDVKSSWIIVAQFGVVFCTSILNYVQWDPSYSHVYSFFLIAGFLYFIRSFFQECRSHQLLLGILLLGLIFLVRPVNLLVILFVPLLANNFSQFLKGIKVIFKAKIWVTLLSVFVVGCILQIQCLVWYAQTGNWFHYGYGEETFYWTDSHFIDFLFSYRKGFFLWAPWFFFVLLLNVLQLIYQRKVYHLLYFFSSFSLLIYVLSSWWCWTYGGSLGSRPMIDYYPVLLLFFVPTFKASTKLFQVALLLITVVSATIMIIQTDQFQRFIITYDTMNESDYWQVFLKTDQKYEGLLWNEKIMLTPKYREFPLHMKSVSPANSWIVSDTLQVNWDTSTVCTVGQLVFNTSKNSQNELLEIRLLDANDSLLTNQFSLLFHRMNERTHFKRADYRFKIQQKLPEKFKFVFVIQTKASEFTIDSLKIRFFTD